MEIVKWHCEVVVVQIASRRNIFYFVLFLESSHGKLEDIGLNGI